MAFKPSACGEADSIDESARVDDRSSNSIIEEDMAVNRGGSACPR
jgi:hypothetical protein